MDFIFQYELKFNNKATIRIALGLRFVKLEIQLSVEKNMIVLLLPLLHPKFYTFKTLEDSPYSITSLPPTLIYDPG